MSKTSQLSQRFRHAIEQGHLRPGDRMPSLRKLCLDHKVSITTAQRAYAELEKQGLIESLPAPVSGCWACPRCRCASRRRCRTTRASSAPST
ncbi:GntR family transcriptional regulator [Chromobacterium sp. Beijing]|uniref:GntR family transcriptional regulator n=1 Tax=Chromobacterium sp. Beijing TaxID=2735795 RepID=UPI001F24B325|nr:winged helix-turn-helix domain-containing protein [Chromobacterium sp. Beijing]UJB31555.1 winged helix-turn-helix transcriptional regulator [Chromobacterium sp. Beijing]